MLLLKRAQYILWFRQYHKRHQSKCTDTLPPELTCIEFISIPTLILMAVMCLPPAMSSSENAIPPAEKPKGPEQTEIKQFNK